MTTKTFRYSITYGLQGCYMPDSITGPYIGNTRRELVSMVVDALGLHDMAKSKVKAVGVARIWSHIKRHGPSVAHFSIADGDHNALSFHGLTEAEAVAMDAENES
jgi:hypothetical protein